MGSADAMFQSGIIRDEMPDYVLIIRADNIYRLGLRPDGTGPH